MSEEYAGGVINMEPELTDWLRQHLEDYYHNLNLHILTVILGNGMTAEEVEAMAVAHLNRERCRAVLRHLVADKF